MYGRNEQCKLNYVCWTVIFNSIANFLKIIFFQLSACLDTFFKTDKGYGNGYNEIKKLRGGSKQECEDDCRSKKNCVGYDYAFYSQTYTHCYQYYTVPTKWFKSSSSTYYSREKCYSGMFELILRIIFYA